MQSLSIEQLNERFALEGIAEIVSGQGNLPKVRITAPAAAAEIYLHGAQVTSWRPAGAEEVLFLSEHSQFQDGHAIRGGIPICFPWFRAKVNSPEAPKHGFVRTKQWQLESIEQEPDAAVITLSTESDDATRHWWPHDFKLVYRVAVGAELKLELTATNTDAAAIVFEEALHTYHRVSDVQQVRVTGLDGAFLLDNTDGDRETQHGDVVFTRQTDNAYLHTETALKLVDPGASRTIHIDKSHSQTTVIWNPWEDGAQSLTDLGSDEWRQMVCVEASNILGYAVDIDATDQHTMTATVKVI